MKQKDLLKVICLTFLILNTTTTQSQVSENFNTNFGTSYGDYGDIGTNSDFDLINGLSDSASKARSGSGRAVRFNKSGSPSLTYTGTDDAGKDNGLGTISFWYRHWNADSNRPTFQVEYSTDSGTNWTAIGSEVEVSSTDYSEFSETVNLAGNNILVRIRVTNTSERIIIDDFSMTNFDDGSGPTADITLSAVSRNTSEDGTTANFTVVLDIQPASDVVVDITSSDIGEVTVSPSQLTFTAPNWDQAQTITLTGVDDADIDEDQEVTITVAVNDALSDAVYHSISKTRTITNVNNDFPPAPSLIITEVADPKDQTQGRFVEIYNNGATAINLADEQIHFAKSVNAGSSYSETALTGTIQPNQVLIIAKSSDFVSQYGFAADTDFSGANGNGDDAYALYYAGDRTSGYLLDVYGEMGVDGTTKAWKYEDTRAYRNDPKNTSANATWTASEWTIVSTDTNVAAMTPGALENEFRYDGHWKPRDVYTHATLSDDVFVSTAVDLTDNLTSANLTIANTATLTINGGTTLILNGTSTGNITYTRTLDTDNWYLMSAPVVGQDIDVFAALHNLATGTGNNIGFSTYENSTAAWSYYQSGGSGTGNFIPGQGHAIKRSTSGNISFTGTFNDADVPIALTKNTNGFNLIGNPYLASVSVAELLNENPTILEELTIWLWNQAQDSYVQKNLIEDAEIAPGQGFFVVAKTAGNFTITEAMQSHATDTFQKGTSSRPEISLFMNNGTANRTAKILYLDNATTGWDNGYDSSIFEGLEHTFQVYTQVVENDTSKKLGIQALPNTAYENRIIPIGVKALATSILTFSVNAQNLPEGMMVFIEDRSNNTFTRLDEANSTFKTVLNTDQDGIGRFYLITSSTDQTLSVDDLRLSRRHVFMSENSTLKITGIQSDKAIVKIHSILGKTIINKTLKRTASMQIKLPSHVTQGIYIVSVTTEHGSTTKKIFIQ